MPVNASSSGQADRQESGERADGYNGGKKEEEEEEKPDRKSNAEERESKGKLKGDEEGSSTVKITGASI